MGLSVVAGLSWGLECLLRLSSDLQTDQLSCRNNLCFRFRHWRKRRGKQAAAVEI